MSTGPCVEPGCPRQAHARGLCNPHYQQRKYAGTLPPVLPKPVPARQPCQGAGCTRTTVHAALCQRCWMRRSRTEGRYDGYVRPDRPAPSRPGRKGKPLTPELMADIDATYRTTGSISQTARAHGMGHERVRKLLALPPQHRTPAAARPARPTPSPVPRIEADPLGLGPCAPIRWDPTATPERQHMIVTAAINRCTGDKRAARRMLGIDQPVFDRAARGLGVTA